MLFVFELPAGKWKLIISIEFVHFHCKSIELVIRRVEIEFGALRCVRSLTHAARSQAEIVVFVVVAAVIIIFLWARFYDLSKAALSTRCIHKLVRIGRLVSSLLEFWRPF